MNYTLYRDSVTFSIDVTLGPEMICTRSLFQTAGDPERFIFLNNLFLFPSGPFSSIQVLIGPSLISDVPVITVSDIT